MDLKRVSSDDMSDTMASGERTPPNTWPIIDAYVRSYPRSQSLVAIESFKTLLEVDIPRALVDAAPPQWGNTAIRVGGPDGTRIRAEMPQLAPATCRLTDATYKTRIIADVTDSSGEQTLAKDVGICDVPLMVGCAPCLTSGASDQRLAALRECRHDVGGYFIIEGKEKAIASVVERSPTCVVYRSSKPKGVMTHSVTAFAGTCVVTAVSKKSSYGPQNALSLSLPGSSGRNVQVPFVTALRAFGPVSDKDIVATVASLSCGVLDCKRAHDLLRATLETVSDHGPLQIAALAEIGKATGFNGTKGALRTIRLSIPGAENDAERSMTLAYVGTQCLLGCNGLPNQCVDRESYEAKVVVPPGSFISRLFSQRWTEHMEQTASNLTSSWQSDDNEGGDDFDHVAHALHDRDMLEIIVKAFRSNTETSAVFDLQRYTMQGVASYVAQVVNPLPSSEIDSREPHQVHPSQYGLICPVESPEGKKIGLTNHFACLASITGTRACTPKAKEELRARTSRHGTARVVPVFGGDRTLTPTLIDGVVVGFAHDPAKLARALRRDRRQGMLHADTSVTWSVGHAVHVRTDRGRLRRPLIVASQARKIADMAESGRLEWSELFTPDQPCLEMLDACEAACSHIAPTIDFGSYHSHTHVEIHPSAVLSHVAATVPYADRNAAPRNVFACKQIKQCASVHSTQFRRRLDTSTHVLHYGQLPIVDTAWSSATGARMLPYGINAMVAIANTTGYNQEDALIINADSVARGMFASTHIHTLVQDENAKEGGVFCDPSSRAIKATAVAYDALQPNGLPSVGESILPGDAVVGHVTKQERDTSLICDLTTHGRVKDAVLFTRTGTSDRRAKVCLQQTRYPCVGDKFASRHGQKGICATMVAASEMPFTDGGAVPDIIINPHALPSRMTVGQLLESIVAKDALLQGVSPVDATIGCTPSCEDLATSLGSRAEMFASEVMHDPRTGRALECAITFAPTFYLRLNHMVADKVNSTSSGTERERTRRDVRTGQPVRGRAESGALRIGEMETNILIAHGTANFLREKFTKASDGLQIHGASFSSGTIHIPDDEYGTLQVRPDNPWISDESVVSAEGIPKSFTVFQAEFAGAGVGIHAYPAASDTAADAVHPDA